MPLGKRHNPGHAGDIPLDDSERWSRIQKNSRREFLSD
jgi:hypothetical protein